MSVRMMVLVAAAGSLLAGATSAFASEALPAPAVYSPNAATQVQAPMPAKRHVRKHSDIAAGAGLIALVAVGAVAGGIAAGSSSSSLPATSN